MPTLPPFVQPPHGHAVHVHVASLPFMFPCRPAPARRRAATSPAALRPCTANARAATTIHSVCARSPPPVAARHCLSWPRLCCPLAIDPVRHKRSPVQPPARPPLALASTMCRRQRHPRRHHPRRLHAQPSLPHAACGDRVTPHLLIARFTLSTLNGLFMLIDLRGGAAPPARSPGAAADREGAALAAGNANGTKRQVREGLDMPG